MPPLIIGLHGAIGSGKTTAAEYLVLNHDFVPHSFAGRLKKGVAAIFGCHVKDLDDQDFKRSCPEGFDKTYRHILQTLGTEWGRQYIDDGIWGKLLAAEIEREYQPVVISDVRFENEAAQVRAMGGIVVHIETDNPPQESGHASDRPLTKADGDLTLYNNQTDLQAFYAEIDKLTEQIYGRQKYSDGSAGTTD